MSGFLTFMDRYRDEAACIAALAELRWPNGFICVGCAGRLAYQLAVRPRVFECADCGRQHSVTAGTVFHRTRTPLRKWFAAACMKALIARYPVCEHFAGNFSANRVGSPGPPEDYESTNH